MDAPTDPTHPRRATRRRRTRRAAALLAMPALLALGCVSESEEPASGRDTNGGDAAPAERADTTAGNVAAGDRDFCDRMTGPLASVFDEVDNSDPDQLLAVAETLCDAAESAAPEMADALGVFVTLAEAAAEAAADPDDTAVTERLSELVFDPRLYAASAAIEDHLVEGCGLDLLGAEELLGTENQPELSIDTGDT